MVEQDDELQPRDSAFWARNPAVLNVVTVPDGAVNLTVEGRRIVGALLGFGRLWRKTYRVHLRGVQVTPAEVVAVWKARFPEFNLPHNHFYPSHDGIAPGEILLISAAVQAMPIHTGVNVIYADEEAFTDMTAEGHPESGWNTFSAYYDDDGCTVVQIQSLARATDPIYELGFRLVGSTAQERIWTHVLEALADHFGVCELVQIEKECIDPKRRCSQAVNLLYNAGIRSICYTITTPLRPLWKDVHALIAARQHH